MIDWFQFLGDNVLDVPSVATQFLDDDVGSSDEEQDVPEVNALVTAEDDSEVQCPRIAVINADKDTRLVENNRASDASVHVAKRHKKAVKQALNRWIRCFPAPYVCHEQKKHIADILHISFAQVTTFCNNYRKRFTKVDKKNMSYMTAYHLSYHGNMFLANRPDQSLVGTARNKEYVSDE